MFQHVVVPVDGSQATAEAARVASRIAASVNGTVELFAVVDASASEAVAQVARSTPDATVVMGAGARARPRALLREYCGPLVLVGPRCDVHVDDAIVGTYVVALDGSIGDEGVLPVVAAWTVEFGGTPWLVDVVDRWSRLAPDVVESAYVTHRAGRLRRRIGRAVEHETLHGGHPARAIVEFAGDAAASLIFVGTDADNRRAQRRRRSLAAEIVRHAACPVVLLRLPEVRTAPKPLPPRPRPPAPPVWSRAWCEQHGPDAVRLRRARPRTRSMSGR
jgi:nucleotide-binding universal stress UspA family protein